MPKCSTCGRDLETVRPCPYNDRFGPSCDDCCEACYESEPFPCPEHDRRSKSKSSTDKENKK